VPPPDRPCVLLSGGIDSALALVEAARDRAPVTPVYVRSGLVWESAEMYWSMRLLQALPGGAAEALVVLDVPVGDLYGEHWSVTGKGIPGAETPDAAVYLPGRNLLVLSKVGVFAGERDLGAIVVGSLAANPFPDARPEFFEAMGRAIGLGMGLGGPLPVEAPLAGLSKAEAVRRAAEAGVPLALTFSCLAPTRGHGHCGACNKCAERKLGFAEAGVPDPTLYGG